MTTHAPVDAQCDHICGTSVSKVINKNTGAVLASCTSEVRESDFPLWWEGAYYKFCPECGADLGDVKKRSTENWRWECSEDAK